jgi:hypothetical protein
VVLAIVVAVVCWGVTATAAAQEPAALVYAYSHPLQATDRLQDGPDGGDIDLDGETLLFWVDQGPGLFFAHPTAYILVSSDGVRIERGSWWPVLNGRTILYGKENNAVITSPFEVSGGDGTSILVHAYPEELMPGDLLADGDAVSAVMWSHTFFAWVDLMPEAFFVHPTVFILVMANGQIVVHHGQWWPLLNGKVILYGSRGDYGVPFPFSLAGP